jgi:preprotein translocase subunit SecA
MGRSGRQGDNGSSRFYISLEDDLMRLFNMDRLATYMDRLSMDEDQELSAGMLNRGVSNAQKKVEERNFAMRKHLLEYDDVLNQQREIIYDLRNKALLSDSIKDTINEFIEDFIFDTIGDLDFKNLKEWDWQDINQKLSSNLLVTIDINEIESLKSIDELIDHINGEAVKYYNLKEDIIPPDLLRKVEKFIVLKTIDEKWRNHLLGMDQLREGIGLRAYGQKNPLIEYKSESYNFFQELMISLRSTVIQRVFHAQVSDQAPTQQTPLQKNIQLQHDEVRSNNKNVTSEKLSSKEENPDDSELKLGRNDKIELISPSGEKIKVKFKKIDQYLMKGYTRV